MMNYINKYRRYLIDLIALALLGAIVFTNSLWYFEYRAQDALYQRLGLTHPDIFILGIDDRAIERFGPYNQWSRQIYADAINILNNPPPGRSGRETLPPAVIAIDILFMGDSMYGEADENMAQAAADGGNVITASVIVPGKNMGLVRVVRDYYTPFAALAENAVYGFANSIEDDDNVVRETQLTARFDGRTLYSFPLEIYRMYMGGRADEDVLDYARENRFAYIPFTAKHDDYSVFSLADIFDDSFDVRLFEGAIVLIGPFAAGMMDSHFTSISRGEQMHGVEIHANVIQMLMDANFKQHVHQIYNYAVIVAVIIIAFALAGLLDIRLVFVIFAAAVAGYLASAYYIYHSHGYLITLVYPIFGLVTVYIYKLVYRFIMEAIEKAKIRGAFKKYVDPKLVDKLMESGEANSDEAGVRKHIAILFVDVRGFTPMTEALKDTPETVVEILNEYLELTANSVFNNGGSVDKFIGDATMALFNGFVPLEDYVFKAVKAAHDIVAGAADVNASVKLKYGVDVGFGVGVNCGDAIVGNLGPSFRKDYTAIGDAVNTAARLESNAQRSQAIISKDVYDLVKDRIVAEQLGAIPLKGKSEPMEIYSVLGIKADE